ncbi:hypothetical protein FH608_017330 [Nonomuraea phyllanthi]|uniref:Uncharacterized protein n=1 Tax=Nonomuraea phyllanthi TaxID=2219224 RepID=A0A5C4WHI9_9ACTN|nr:hypothetical protein [Nonomuraea phyllanthi]KAB8193965.1 hypothetical protein FH608_017330 [Nonomuraea phyllanthi]
MADDDAARFRSHLAPPLAGLSTMPDMSVGHGHRDAPPPVGLIGASMDNESTPSNAGPRPETTTQPRKNASSDLRSGTADVDDVSFGRPLK